ncbi:MAG TPA: hypothetical protein VG944_08680 [Fimbriimonas sp.]|nr:hypothetical protein [Fimbriimonas sp.]
MSALGITPPNSPDALLLRQAKADAVPAKSPSAAGVASPNGAPQQAAVNLASGNTSAALNPSVQADVQAKQAADAKAQRPPVTVNPAIQAMIDWMKGQAGEDRGRADELMQQGQQGWQNVHDLQQQMMGSPTPHMQAGVFNPLTGLLTALVASSMQSRFGNQPEQFVGNLEGGLQQQNQTNFQNQMAQHQHQMALLQSAVQAANEQARMAQYGAQMYRPIAGEMSSAARVLGQNVADQQNNQGRIDVANIGADARRDVANISADERLKGVLARASSKETDNLFKGMLNAPPAERIAFAQMIKEKDPAFANWTPEQIQGFGDLSPKEQMQIQQGQKAKADAGFLGAKADELRMLDPAKLANLQAMAKRANSEADAALMNATSKQGLDNATVAKIREQTRLMEPEFRARAATLAAQAHHLDSLATDPTHNQIQLLQLMQKNAQGQASLLNAQIGSILKANGGVPPDPGTPEREVYDNFVTQQIAANGYLNKVRKQINTLGQASQPNIQPGFQANTNKPFNPSGLPAGPIGNPPLQYVGGHNPNAVVPQFKASIQQMIDTANKWVQQGRVTRQQALQKLRQYGITAQ